MDRCRLPWSRHLPSGCLECRCNIRHQLMLETSYLVMETHANSTLSKCMLLACAYQSAKENGHCQKKTCQGFGRLFGKGGLFGRPFFKTNPQELSTLCIYPENSWTTQRMCQSTNILSITNFAQYFILQLMRNIPWTTMTSIELRLLNTCCITQKVRCWGGNNQKDTAKEQGHGRKTYKVFSLNPLLLIWGR